MLVRNIDSVDLEDVTMEGTCGAKMAVMVGRDDGAPNFALRQIVVEPDGHTPHHAHDYEHEVFVVSGTGTIIIDDETHALKAGDVVYVPADHQHQFRAGTEGLRFLCLVPASRNCGEPTPGS